MPYVIHVPGLVVPGVLHSFALSKIGSCCVLFALPDIGHYRHSVKIFISIAIKICESLSDVHIANIIHKDINSSNIVFNPKTGQLKIIDCRMEPIIGSYQGFIDKYIGDAIMALFSGEADNAVKSAIAMLHQLADYNQHRSQASYAPIQIGIGINTGSLMLGTVGGHNRMDGTVISDAVNLASRIESLTEDCLQQNPADRVAQIYLERCQRG